MARRFPRAAGWLAVMWAGCAITHPLPDMLTERGSGVMLWFRFSDARLFFQGRPHFEIGSAGLRGGDAGGRGGTGGAWPAVDPKRAQMHPAVEEE